MKNAHAFALSLASSGWLPVPPASGRQASAALRINQCHPNYPTFLKRTVLRQRGVRSYEHGITTTAAKVTIDDMLTHSKVLATCIDLDDRSICIYIPVYFSGSHRAGRA
jgi:hypothetical protein